MINLELKIPPVAVVFVFGLLMWLVSEGLPPHGFSGALVRVFSMILIAAGIMAGVLGVLAFLKAKTTVDPMLKHTTSSLVTSGIYGISRNPMYLGLLLLLAGFGFYLNSIYSLSLCFGFILYMNRFQIEPEERFLASRFPEAFASYKSKVRRWF